MIYESRDPDLANIRSVFEWDPEALILFEAE